MPAGAAAPGDAAARPLLACGAELKNTFCVAKGTRAWVGHHIGDLENFETLSSFTEGIEHFERLFAVEPEVVAHDLHPEYLSTKYALEREGVELDRRPAPPRPPGRMPRRARGPARRGDRRDLRRDRVRARRHASGAASCCTATLPAFERVGALLRRPAARAASRRSASRGGWRARGLRPGDRRSGEPPPIPRRARRRVDAAAWRQVAGSRTTGLASPLTTSVGRLFDAVAALCGLRTEINYEGQAAIELEAACDPHERAATRWAISGGSPVTIDPRETIVAVAADVDAGAPAGAVAARFHAALAAATVEACTRAASEHGTELVVLSGGVFANRRLLEATAGGLTRAGLEGAGAGEAPRRRRRDQLRTSGGRGGDRRLIGPVQRAHSDLGFPGIRRSATMAGRRIR